MDDYEYPDINAYPSFDIPSFSSDSSGYLLDLGDALSFGDVLGTFNTTDLGDLLSTFQSQDIDPYAEFDVDTAQNFGFDLPSISADAENQEGGFYGNIPGQAEYDPRTNSTILYNPDGSIRQTIVHDEREYDAENQPGGFYGNTPNATYDPKTNLTTVRNPDGSTRVIQGPPGPGTTNNITKTIKEFYDRVTGSGANKQDALLLSLLGGLMGLLGKGSGVNKGPVGYKGEIPKYTAVRGPAASPTAGGRRPGGAGIGSLAGSTRYVPAAAGGLMGLKEGRFLNGKTDGMADKIQTDIDGKQPARLSHGEFVIPADVVSHLGNGNSDAGADVLYEMMDKVRVARTGNKKQGRQINPRKYTPA